MEKVVSNNCKIVKDMEKRIKNVVVCGDDKAAVEAMIAVEILANKGEVMLDADDVQDLKDDSNIIDGATINGKVDELGELANKAILQVKDAHPENQLASIIIKMRVAEAGDLLMEHMGHLYDVFESLGENVSAKWGIEMNAPIADEIRICVLCGFK